MVANSLDDFPKPYTKHFKARDLVTSGSTCRTEPVAAFLGFLNFSSPSLARRSFSFANSERSIYTSPRTSIASGAPPFKVCGISFIVLIFSVTSSPTRPSPRVAAIRSFPYSYIKFTDRPSILGSATKSISCSSFERSRFCTLTIKVCTSVSPNRLPSERIGETCSTS